MKGRIETGNLQELRLPLSDRAHRGQVVGQMKGSEGDEALQGCDDLGSYGDRFGVLGSAVHDTMTDRSWQPSTDVLPQECNDLVERGRRVAHISRRIAGIDQRTPGGVLGQQSRPRADAIDLTLHAPVEPITPRNGEQLEFDARAACVDDKNGVLHR